MTLGISWTMEALTWGERSRHFCLYVVDVWVYEVFERTSWFGGVLKVTEVTSSSLFIFLLFWQNKSCLLSPARFLAFRNDFQLVDFSIVCIASIAILVQMICLRFRTLFQPWTVEEFSSIFLRPNPTFITHANLHT